VVSGDAKVELRLGHSPDPDDAFMWWPLEADGRPAAVSDPRFRFRSVPRDIESLNRLACGDVAGEALEITALSCAAYPAAAERYLLTACGSSVGEGYGPKLVARSPVAAAALRGARIAVPGRRTTAFTVASLLLGPEAFTPVEIDFDRIEEAVAAGEVEAGVVIHEGQLTFESKGLHLVEDLGAWWRSRTGLPLPLGANAVRRDLAGTVGEAGLRSIAGLLRRSVEHALAHRDEGTRRAMGFARGLDASLADRFIGMYVNRWTLDYGPTGRAAVARLLGAAAAAGLVPPLTEVEFLDAAGRERVPVAIEGL
jgi:1,4-dihydroxy-6-naphthoate synthase